MDVDEVLGQTDRLKDAHGRDAMISSNQTSSRVCQMALLTALCLSLLATLSLATSFTARPALSAYTNAVDVGTWCGKALAERRAVIWSTNAALPACNSQQGRLTELKGAATDIFPWYANQTLATGGNYTAYFRSASPDDQWFPLWTGTGMAVSLSLPTNYFVSTPWSGLPTNAYGWVGMSNVMKTLSWTVVDWGDLSSSIPAGVQNTRTWEGWSTSSWANAKAAAAANPVTSRETFGDPSKATGGNSTWYDCNRFHALAITRFFDLVCHVNTQFFKYVDFYVMGGPSYFPYGGDEDVFDGNGDGITTNWVFKATQSGTRGVFSNRYGDVTLKIGTWARQPICLEYISRGYDSWGWVVARWTGFQYK